MDIVYVFKEGKNRSVEMRYSLMFLANIPHDRVFVVGDLPGFSKYLNQIPYSDKPGQKISNVKDKYRLIVDSTEISEDFILMHDDILALQPMKEIPIYTMGKLKDRVELIEKTFGKNLYWKAINNIYEQFPDGLNYDLHTPGLFNKTKLKYILDNFENIGATKSFYHNYYKTKGQPVEKDFKIHRLDQINRDILDREFLSTDDAICYNDKIWEMLDLMLNQIPDKLRYQYIRDDDRKHSSKL